MSNDGDSGNSNANGKHTYDNDDAAETAADARKRAAHVQDAHLLAVRLLNPHTEITTPLEVLRYHQPLAWFFRECYDEGDETSYLHRLVTRGDSACLALILERYLSKHYHTLCTECRRIQLLSFDRSGMCEACAACVCVECKQRIEPSDFACNPPLARSAPGAFACNKVHVACEKRVH